MGFCGNGSSSRSSKTHSPSFNPRPSCGVRFRTEPAADEEDNVSLDSGFFFRAIRALVSFLYCFSKSAAEMDLSSPFPCDAEQVHEDHSTAC